MQPMGWYGMEPETLAIGSKMNRGIDWGRWSLIFGAWQRKPGTREVIMGLEQCNRIEHYGQRWAWPFSAEQGKRSANRSPFRVFLSGPLQIVVGRTFLSSHTGSTISGMPFLSPCPLSLAMVPGDTRTPLKVP